MRNRLPFISALCTLFAASVSTPASAQDATWRHDYTAARKEASETGKPILMDFGTEACVWCRKLDATTFRDPKVVKLLNERFIPLKVDADRQPKLAQALGIESYPTLVLASADGKVLGRQVGYADVGQLMGLLGKAPAREPKTPQPPASPTVNGGFSPVPSGMLARARVDFEEKRYADCLVQCEAILIAQPTSNDAQDARRLQERIATDPNIKRALKEQIEVGLVSLQPKIAASLEK